MKKLRVFETFAGIGAQTKALTNIGANYEVVATSEWYIDAIIGYNAIHNKKFKKYKREEALKFLINFTISRDSKTPLKSFDRLSDEQLSKLVSSIKANKNLGSILDIRGEDVPEHDVLTYSFPCQDLSIAGKGKGISEDAGTRSSLMWQIERILSEMNSVNRPSFLLMENVPPIQNIKYKPGLDKFKKRLSSLGYKEHIEIVLDASKLGIPQRRKRYFMISVHDNPHIVGGGGVKNRLLDLPKKVKPLKFKVKDIVSNDAKYTNREQQYIDAINEKGLKLDAVYRGLGVYPTFAQANIVTGIKHDTIGTVTFSGENSRQRIVKKESGKTRVIECGGIENIRLMGFDKSDYTALSNAGLNSRKISGLAGNSIVVQQLEEIFKIIEEVL